MTVRDEWVEAGFAALRAGGIDAVRIDSLAAGLHRTKGSFHHHFAGAAAFHQALLERFADNALHELAALTAAAAGLTVTEALARVAAGTRFDPALEAAIRGWAEGSPDARNALTLVDTARLDALTEIWSRALDDREQARAAALIPHLVLIGASVAQPTPTPPDLERVFALLAHLVPHVGASATP